mgnify:CR=1 FL=1
MSLYDDDNLIASIPSRLQNKTIRFNGFINNNKFLFFMLA